MTMAPAARPTGLTAACAAVGLDATGAVLLRHHVNAVYHLPRCGAVARLGPPGRTAQARRVVEVTRWLCARGFPATAPLDVDQPVEVDAGLVTFWRYYDGRDRPLPPPAALAGLLRHLHRIESPPHPLPVLRPLASFLDELRTHGPRVLAPAERDFLWRRADELLATYRGLESTLGSGLIHGDARVGNLLWDGDAVVLGDWDSVCLGPREVDLVVTCQGTRYGRSRAVLDNFGEVYGWDVRTWPGFATLRDIRDLQTLAAPLRLAVERPEVAAELRHRIAGLRAGDLTQQWHAF